MTLTIEISDQLAAALEAKADCRPVAGRLRQPSAATKVGTGFGPD